VRDCPHCHGELVPTEFSCRACELALRGDFTRSRLDRLSGEHQQLVEALLLAGGNLKELERELGVSYPTVRKRVGEARMALEVLLETDRKRIDDWLGQVERGELNPELAARHIDGLGGA
jgi:hypothetical protein